jgi:hypothetical protein
VAAPDGWRYAGPPYRGIVNASLGTLRSPAGVAELDKRPEDGVQYTGPGPGIGLFGLGLGLHLGCGAVADLLLLVT